MGCTAFVLFNLFYDPDHDHDNFFEDEVDYYFDVDHDHEDCSGGICDDDHGGGGGECCS